MYISLKVKFLLNPYKTEFRRPQGNTSVISVRQLFALSNRLALYCCPGDACLDLVLYCRVSVVYGTVSLVWLEHEIHFQEKAEEIFERNVLLSKIKVNFLALVVLPFKLDLLILVYIL